MGGLAFKMGWINSDILVSLAVSVPLSFILAAQIERKGHTIYQRSAKWLKEQAAESLHQGSPN